MSWQQLTLAPRLFPLCRPGCRQQIHNAVIYQRMLQKFSSVSEDPPTWRQLTAVGLASGLPFVVRCAWGLGASL